MSTEVQPTTVIDVTRVLGRRPGAPYRAAVQASPAGAADAAVGTIRQTVPAVEQAADATFRAPLWKRAAVGSWGVVKTAGLGTGPLRRAWRYQRAATFADQIREVETMLSITTDPEVRKALHAEIGVLEAARKETARSRHREPESIAKGAAGGMFVLTLLIVAFMVTPLVPAGVAAASAGSAYVAGRREQKRRAEATIRAIAAAQQRKAIEGGSGQTAAAGGAMLAEGALDGGALASAFKAAGFTGSIVVTEFEDLGDGATLTHFELPSHVTVTKLRKQDEVIAGALGRDLSMIDITKEGAANRGSLWMTDRDPFEDPRPSPLLTHRGAVDAWSDGVPVAWSKRGDYVRLPIKNSNFLIAGMTRSGKGVGAANLAAGAAKDIRVNLRFVAGKVNGEWDPYAKTGIASTYFKPDPERLLALLKAEIADGDRRNRLLGAFGKSKLTPETIERLGGLEVVVIDELATFTRSGKSLRDEILDALIYISSVLAGAGILLVLITQYPEADVVPQALAMNCGTRWAMRVDNATQSNAILGGGASSSGRDASKFDPPRPGLGWLVNPFLGVTDLARSFDLDEDERGEVTQICEQAAELREAAGRLTGQWDDPIERHLLNATGLSSAAGGPRRDGQPGRALATLTAEQKQQLTALKGALAAMDQLDRDAAQLTEMAGLIGGDMTDKTLGDLLRAAGAGGTVKVSIPGIPNRVNGYNRADIRDALDLFEGH